MKEQSDMARRPMVNLDGRTAIITGSGKGIGAAVAKCLASHGAAVVINYVHDAASAQRTVEDIHSLGRLRFIENIRDRKSTRLNSSH